MSKDLRKMIEELKQRRDNLDAVIKILEDEVCPEEEEPERKRRDRPRKSEAAFFTERPELMRLFQPFKILP